MAINDFRNLIEIQSLQKVILEHEKQIQANNHRITYLNSMKDKRALEKEQTLNDKEQLKKQMSQLEKELFQKETLIEKNKSQLATITDQQIAENVQSSIDELETQTNLMQEEILSILDREETLESKITEITQFFSSIDTTIAEIQEEVNHDNQAEEKKIAGLNERIHGLKSIIEPQFLKQYHNTAKRIPPGTILSQIQGGACQYCRFNVPTIMINQIESGDRMEFCSSCGRILCPVNAVLR